MKVFLDYDYTLLKTEELKRALAKLIGVSWKEYKDTYQKSKVDGNYSWKKHLKLLKRDDDITKARIGKFLEKNVDSFLQEGAKELLERLNDSGYELILFTKGDEEWQKEKLRHSIISKFCNIYYEEGDKEHALEKFKEKAKKEKIIIINDKAEEADKMKKVIPESEVYIVDGPYSEKEKGRKVYTINELFNNFFPSEIKHQFKGSMR